MFDAGHALPLLPFGEHRPMRADNAVTSRGDSRPQSSPSLGAHRPRRVDDGSLDEVAPGQKPLLPPADPEAAPQATSRHAASDALTVLAAISVHAAVLFTLISTPATEFGDGGNAPDAISVSIVSASALDSRQPTSETAASAAPAHLAPNPGDDSDASEATPERSAPPEPKIERPAIEQPEPRQELAAPAEPAPEVVAEEAPTVSSRPAPPEEPETLAIEPSPTPPPPEKRAEDTPREEAPTPPSPSAAAAGGAVSHGTAADRLPQAAAAAASRGEVDAYGMAVQSALLAVDQRAAKARASASQAKGTVVVRLSLDERGSLVSAEVVQSSGRAQLDDAALLLIRLAAFPPPPPGLTVSERSYLAPIRFR